jgi:hypothetical protein
VDDPAVVAAIAAGELDGLATALERYAAALYEHCYATVPAVAAEAVRDTFVIAWSSVDQLRDPAKFYPWLQAVADHECSGRTPAGRPAEAKAGPPPEPTLPPNLPGQVLSVCADNSSVGRAYRVSVTYRAGPFGHDGFPKAGSRLRTRRSLAGGLAAGLRGRRRPLAAVTAVAALTAVLAVASTILASVPSGSPRPGRAVVGAARASGAVSASRADLPTTPARPIRSSRSGRSSPAAPAPSAQSPTSALAAGGARPSPTAGTSMTGTLAKPSPVPMPTVTPGPAPAATAVRGVLSVDQNQLHFVSVNGGDSTRTFVITAKDGPVTGYTIAVPPGLPGSLTVSPSSGSLAGGASATITVTAASTVPFVTSLTVHPGGPVIAIAVDVKANPQHRRHKSST